MAQRKASLDTGWKFHRGDVVNAEVAEYDDSKWRTLTVPHDFSMEPAFDPSDERQRLANWSEIQVGPFSRLSVGNWDTGQTVGGTGWYRKTFLLPIQGNATLDTYLSQTNVNIRFDGVYNQAEVWVNGVKAAVNVYGYMPFVINLNKILSDAKNRRTNNEPVVTVAVKAVNEGLNSRWYAGSGIFRHVWLETTEKLHLDEWDTYVDGSELINKGKDANVKVFAKVFNEDTRSAVTQFCVDILDAGGNTVAHQEKEFTISASNTAGADVAVEMDVKAPHLWSVEDPYRYTAKVYALLFALVFTDIIGTLLLALAVYAGAFTVPVLWGLLGLKAKPKFVGVAIIAGGLLALAGKLCPAGTLGVHTGDILLIAAFTVNGIILALGRKAR